MKQKGVEMTNKIYQEHLQKSNRLMKVAGLDVLSEKASEKGRMEDFPMAENEKDCGNFLKGFVIGGVWGVLAGIFFAPKSGKELRSELKEKGSEVLKEGKEIYADAGAKAKEIIEEAKRQAKELKKEADQYISEARQKTKEILAYGGKKEGEASESAKDIPGGREV